MKYPTIGAFHFAQYFNMTVASQGSQRSRRTPCLAVYNTFYIDRKEAMEIERLCSHSNELVSDQRDRRGSENSNSADSHISHVACGCHFVVVISHKSDAAICDYACGIVRRYISYDRDECQSISWSPFQSCRGVALPTQAGIQLPLLASCITSMRDDRRVKYELRDNYPFSTSVRTNEWLWYSTHNFDPSACTGRQCVGVFATIS